MRVEDIPKKQMHILSQMLWHHPSEPRPNYISRVFSLEPQVDRPYLRPDFLHRLVQRPQSYYTKLCDVHKILNAKVVHQIFMLLANEVGLRLNSLVVAGRDKLGHETWDVSILNLRSLHGAWLRPEVFWDTFGGTLDVPSTEYTDEDYMTKWIKEGTTCEACILARIGGDINTVFDLQMVLKSRTRTRNVQKFKQPRLGELIEGWLDVWKFDQDADQWRAKLEWNRLRGERLKRVRKQMARDKKRTRLERGDEAGEVTRHRKPKITIPPIEHPQQRTDEAMAAMRSPPLHPPRPPRSRDSEETLRPSSSSDTPKQKSEPASANSSDDEDEPEIRHTLHAAENEIIDCYAALISTPFLPGMDKSDHQRRASILSLHSDAMTTQSNEASWPMVGNETNDQQLGRSQSTRQRRSSDYSESVYSQVSNSLQAATNFLPPNQRDSHSTVKRSATVQDKRNSDRSWMTASIAPSDAPSATPPRSSALNNARRPKKPERRFDTISEEVDPPDRSNTSRHSERAVSPMTIRENDHGHGHDHQNPFSHYQIQNGRNSPVSPVSPVSQISPTTPIPTRTSSRRHDKAKHSAPTRAPPSASNSSRAKPGPNDRGDSSSSPSPKLKSRLSRPFSGPSNQDTFSPPPPKPHSRLSQPFDSPSAQDNSLLSSARKLRDSTASSIMPVTSPTLPPESGSERGRGRTREREGESSREGGRQAGRERGREKEKEAERDWERRGTAATTWSDLYGNQRERILRLEDQLRGVDLDGDQEGKGKGKDKKDKKRERRK